MKKPSTNKKIQQLKAKLVSLGITSTDVLKLRAESKGDDKLFAKKLQKLVVSKNTNKVAVNPVTKVDFTELIKSYEKEAVSIVKSIVKLEDSIVKSLSELPEIPAFPTEIKVSNFPEQKEFPTKIQVNQKSKPVWYKAPPEEVSIKNTVKVEQDNGIMLSFFTGALQTMIEFFGKLANKTFKTELTNESYLKPQTVVLYDPVRKQAVDIKELFKIIIHSNGGGSSGGGASALTINGNFGAGDGNGTVVTAGTPVQLSSVSTPCKRVVVYNNANPDTTYTNNAVMAVGSSTVSAALLTRRGATIYPANGMEFKVSNLNMLWVDCSDSGVKFNYYYEI